MWWWKKSRIQIIEGEISYLFQGMNDLRYKLGRIERKLEELERGKI